MMNALTTTIALGAMTGVRTMAGPLCARQMDRRGPLARAGLVIDGLAVLESLADKFAPLPPRSEALPLFGRAAVGAALGYLLNKEYRIPFALLGAAAAAAGAICATELRRVATKKYRVPDFVMGVAEDAALASAGVALVRASR